MQASGPRPTNGTIAQARRGRTLESKDAEASWPRKEVDAVCPAQTLTTNVARPGGSGHEGGLRCWTGGSAAKRCGRRGKGYRGNRREYGGRDECLYGFVLQALIYGTTRDRRTCLSLRRTRRMMSTVNCQWVRGGGRGRAGR